MVTVPDLPVELDQLVPVLDHRGGARPYPVHGPRHVQRHATSIVDP
ncbi:MAG: hypothetical protein NVV70_02280 [Cellulomonas sp.]|nr:hypothetical protein [Cellulomonas sp.]MCR6647009.1 hypothetical protein [Cellulomonas sp.]